MIREKLVFTCVCAKCKHYWTTKDHELPDTCAKCKTRKWNDDHQPEILQIEAATKATAFDGVQMNDAMSKFLTRVVVESPVVEVEPDVWHFTKEPGHWPDDGNCYRQQYLVANPKRRRAVEVDDTWSENILRIV